MLAGAAHAVSIDAMDVPSRPAEAVLDRLIARLHGHGRPRVWSMVITVFGDAVVPRGGRIALTALQDIMGRLRVEAGALRTAMSRLAADGWVIRERNGRSSFYRLAEEGRHAFDRATRRIYAAGPPAWDGAWTVAVAPPDGAAELREKMEEAGFLRVEASVYLRPETRNAPDPADALAGMLVIHGNSAEHPEAMRMLWPSDEIAAAYRAFIEAHRPLLGAFRRSGSIRPLDAMAARTLLVHDWRRIVLRDPGLPLALLPRHWPGEEARTLARDVYGRLLEPSEAWLGENGLPPLAHPREFAGRFGRGERQD
jgi:phenylacetic acid degradation operon negative regulatory protein